MMIYERDGYQVPELSLALNPKLLNNEKVKDQTLCVGVGVRVAAHKYSKIQP